MASAGWMDVIRGGGGGGCCRVKHTLVHGPARHATTRNSLLHCRYFLQILQISKDYICKQFSGAAANKGKNAQALRFEWGRENTGRNERVATRQLSLRCVIFEILRRNSDIQ